MTKLQILFLEDNPLDAEVVRVTLSEGGIDCELRQVETRNQFITAIETDRFDLILADYAMPGFDGLTALEIALDLCPDVPFIFVSGSMGEELAIESLKLGATDYVLKQRLERLVSCVRRALKEAQKQRECQQIAKALGEREAQFRSFAENSNDVIWMTEAQGYRLVYVSPSYERLWGRSSEEIYDDLNNFLSYVHPEDRDCVCGWWQQCSQGGFIQEYRVIRPNGEIIWIRDRGFPIYDDERNLLWLGGIAEDISERKQAEADMAKDLSDTRLLQALSARLITEDNIQVLYDEIMAAAIEFTRADAGTMQSVEEETQELLILASQGLEQKTVEYFYRIDASSNTACGIALETRKRTIINYDVPKSEDPDGSLQKLVEGGFICGQSTPLISCSGKPIGMVSTHWHRHYQPTKRQLWFLDVLARQAADAIERKQAEIERERLLAQEEVARAEAEQANRVKDRFLAIVSHELRSPLNPILGWTMLLQTQTLDPTQTIQALDTIERNAKLQAELIEDLLDISRILRGKLSLDIVEVDLVSTIRSANETIRLAAESKSIQIHTMLEPDIGLVSGDPNRLQQVLWNLFSNAVKFTPEGGLVDIRLENLGSTAQITVSDTGKGIAPNFLPYVFDYFLQEDGATTRKYGGLGLGLAIVHHLVELHGGTIRADSPGEGQGATFTVKLPLKNTSSQTPDNHPSEEQALDLNGIEVLVVDDDRDTRELMTFLLEQSGAKAIAASCASEALDVLTHSSPNILLSDIGMPEVDGYMLMRQIRDLPAERGGQIPAIALTAFAGEINYQQAMSAGFQSHISKPVDTTKLIKAIISLAR